METPIVIAVVGSEKSSVHEVCMKLVERGAHGPTKASMLEWHWLRPAGFRASISSELKKGTNFVVVPSEGNLSTVMQGMTGLAEVKMIVVNVATPSSGGSRLIHGVHRGEVTLCDTLDTMWLRMQASLLYDYLIYEGRLM